MEEMMDVAMGMEEMMDVVMEETECSSFGCLMRTTRRSVDPDHRHWDWHCLGW